MLYKTSIALAIGAASGLAPLTVLAEAPPTGNHFKPEQARRMKRTGGSRRALPMKPAAAPASPSAGRMADSPYRATRQPIEQYSLPAGLASSRCWPCSINGASMRHSYSEAHLYWQVRHEQEAIYRDVLLMLSKRSPALQVRLLVSRPRHGSPERISVEWLRAELGAFSHTDFYLCAGTSLLESLLAGLRAAGVADAALHFERFTLGPADMAQDWHIHYQGRQFSAAGHASLLDAIESQGLPIDSDCRTGSCGRCLLMVEDGQAKHRVAPECAVAPGQVLACCAVPLSDVRLRAATNVVTAAGT